MLLTPQQIQERFLKLPPELRDAIFSEDITSAIMAIGKKYGLAIDKIGELHSETNHVILGASHPKDFISNLEKRLEVDKETARKIAHEVNQQIFARIRESLKKLHNIAGEESSAISPLKPTAPGETPPPFVPPSPSVTDEHSKVSAAAPAAAPTFAEAMAGKEAVADKSEGKKVSFSELKTVSSEASSVIPKAEETTSATPSAPDETLIPSAPPEPVKSIFEEKMKDEVFRQEPEETKAEVSIPVDAPAGEAEAEPQKEAEEIMPDAEKQVEEVKTGDYPGNVDPYREQPTEHEIKPKERAA